MGCRWTENWIALLSLLLLAGCEHSPGSPSPPKKLAATPPADAAPEAPVATQRAAAPQVIAAPQAMATPRAPAQQEAVAAPQALTTDDGQKKPAVVDPVKVNGPIFEGW